jgi:hypothetical protein
VARHDSESADMADTTYVTDCRGFEVGVEKERKCCRLA